MERDEKEDSDERKLLTIHGERLAALEERVRQWQHSADRRFTQLHRMMWWIITASVGVAGSLAVKFLTGGSPVP